MREASTKPIAATVLPAPVACSNQKRLCALGSSAAPLVDVLVDVARRRPPRRPRARSSGSSSLLLGLVLVVLVLVVVLGGGLGLVVVLVVVELVGVELGLVGLVGLVRRGGVGLGLGLVVDGEHRRGGRRRPRPCAVLRGGQQRGQRARERVDLVRVEQRAVGEARLVLGEQALEAEQQRVARRHLRRRDLRAGVDLGQRGVERAAAGGAGGERVRGVLAVVHEALARERSRRARCRPDRERRAASTAAAWNQP